MSKTSSGCGGEARDMAEGIAAAMLPALETELARRLNRVRMSALDAARPRIKAGEPVRFPPPEVLEAAVAVADAYDRLAQARFSAEEGPALTALTRRAEALRNAVRRLQR